MLKYIIKAEQIQFSSVELIGHKVRISHSGREGKRWTAAFFSKREGMIRIKSNHSFFQVRF